MDVFEFDGYGNYIGQSQCPIDPLESATAGHDVFLIPPNSTALKPLPKKSGFNVIFDGKKWVYVEIIVPEPEIVPEPTRLEILYNELNTVKRKLTEYDYIGIKIATGRATLKEYSDEIALMTKYASEIDTIKAEIATHSKSESIAV